MSMQFSVLLSLYYKENSEYLRQSLDSIFNQTLKPDEVVLVEDGPLTTELYNIINEYIKRFPIIKIVPLARNSGLGNALKEGLKYCTNDIIARMDTDDISKPDRFQKQISFLDKHPEIDVVGAWIDEFINDISNVVSIRKLPETNDEIYDFGKKRNPINHPVVMFRKKAVEAAGGYLPFYLFEDYYLWVRMLLNGSRFYNIQESLLYFRSSHEMFYRRGGIKYAYVECKFYLTLFRLGYINIAETIINISIRFFTRILPNKVRRWIYKNIIR